MVTADDRLDALIARLYDAAVGTWSWDAVLRDLPDFFGAALAAFGIVGPHTPGRILHTGIDPAMVERYLLHHAGRNELALLVDGAANVLRSNAAGGALLAARDGLLADRAGGGALRAWDAGETAALRRMVAAAVERPGIGADGAAPLYLSRPPLVVAVLPPGAAGASSLGLPPAAAALLLATDPAHWPAPPSRAVLREAFGLTRAEAEVAARTGQGEEVARIAEALGITQGTTRLHLHRIFEKTGVHRQAELALVLSGLHR